MNFFNHSFWIFRYRKTWIAITYGFFVLVFGTVVKLSMPSCCLWRSECLTHSTWAYQYCCAFSPTLLYFTQLGSETMIPVSHFGLCPAFCSLRPSIINVSFNPPFHLFSCRPLLLLPFKGFSYTLCTTFSSYSFSVDDHTIEFYFVRQSPRYYLAV